MHLREFNGEIRAGHLLLVDCVRVKDGEQHCCGKIRIPFDPPLSGSEPYTRGRTWRRVSGESIDTLTLEPSIDAGECGHFFVSGGHIITC